MTGKPKFLLCGVCGNMADLIADRGAALSCCGKAMTELVPNTEEASTEKHLPAAAAVDGGVDVQVGGVPHPMEEAHYIAFIHVASEQGGQRQNLKPGDSPKRSFRFLNDKPAAAYAYCNLHGLLKTDIP